MPSFQTSLGEGVAEELAESQREISIAEFFEKNKHMLGFDSEARALVTAVKEGVDNSLDAAEEAGILPDIYIDISEVGDYYQVVIEDNGPGITRDEIPKVFGKLLYGSRFHQREQSLTPDQRVMIKREGEVEFVPIGVLCDAYLPESGDGTAPIPIDIEAPSFNRDSHEVTWQPVTHAIRHETDEQTYEITTERGRTVEITGNHSLFTLTADGETTEQNAADLEPGDTILTPRQLPTVEDPIESVNLLEHLRRDQLADRRMSVYGFDKDTLKELRSGETIRKYPNSDSDRRRCYYRYGGVDILKDSLEQNYLQEGYLPAETVIELGWEDRAADCTLKTYQVGGDSCTVPVTIPVDESFVEMLAYYISEGHAGPRQVGFTFGSQEGGLIERTEQAIAGLSGSSTTVTRERNSTGVKAFGSPLALFLKNVCGGSADTKQVPGFVFEIDPPMQRRFIEALYESDGSEAHPANQLSHTTTSETLARQLSVLWSMQGVLASTAVAEDPNGYADVGATQYRTKVFGEDITTVEDVEQTLDAGEQSYKRVPTPILDEVRVTDVPWQTVPDTIPGLLMGAGVGSSLEDASVYKELIESALDGDYVDESRYVYRLKEMGLLDTDHQPTEDLLTLWETINDLQGITETDMCLVPVRDVTPTEPPEYVYDLSVPGETGADENFVVVNDGALSVKNSRGQQGIGISAAVLYAQLTSGKPARITSRTQGADSAQYFEVVIDTESNEPEIRVNEETTWDRPHGTRIELEMEANMRARQRLHDYVQHTAVVNPHARVELQEPDAHLKFERATEDLPQETKTIRPHPHGVELGTLLNMLADTDSYSISGFLQGEFTRVGGKTADSVVDAFRDRYYGRELGWSAPRAHDEVDLARELQQAVSNKGRQPTAAFADRVADTLTNRERNSYTTIETVVDTVADDIEAEFDVRFGSTVRENAVAAAWRAVTADIEADLYPVIDEATSTQKDDATVKGLTDRLADKIADTTDDNPRHRFSRAAIAALVDNAADRTEEFDDATVGDTARENVVTALWTRMETVDDDPPNVSTVADDRDAASNLLDGMRSVDIMAPPTDCLSPITAGLVEAGLKKEYDAEFYAAATRDADVHGGDPFIVEAGIAYGGDVDPEGSIDLLRFANRVPLVYQRGACAITDVVTTINWRNYGLDQPGGSGMPQGPAVISVHVASTNVPFTSESKDAVANVPAIEDEIELALREAGRELKSHINRRESMQQRRRKRNVLADILPTMAEKVTELTGNDELDIDDSLARIMNNVLVERRRENGTVTIDVRNFDSSKASLELTEIVSMEPEEVSTGSVVEVDGDWFISWEPDVPGGESVSLSYAVDDEADLELDVKGVEGERLTIDT